MSAAQHQPWPGGHDGVKEEEKPGEEATAAPALPPLQSDVAVARRAFVLSYLKAQGHADADVAGDVVLIESAILEQMWHERLLEVVSDDWFGFKVEQTLWQKYDGTKKLPTFPFAHMVPVQYEWPWAEAWFDYVHAAVAGGRDGIQTMREYSLVAMQAEKDRVRRLH